MDIHNRIQFKIIDLKLAQATVQCEILASYLIDFDGFRIQTEGALVMAPKISALLAKNRVAAALKLGQRSKLGRMKY